MRLARVAIVGTSMFLALVHLVHPEPSSASVSSPSAAPAPIRHFRVATVPDPLRINEILPAPARDWDGSGTFSSRDDEWVELVNSGPAALDLAGYFVTDADTLPRYALSGSLAAGGHLMVFGLQSFNWEKANGYPSFGLSLGNSGDAVMLWKVTGGDTTLVDQYTYGSHEAGADRAIGRVPDGTGDWTLFDSLDPYTGTLLPPGSGCAPTPGLTNVCGTTPVRAATWGRLKEVYR
jgi:hypothetical protein